MGDWGASLSQEQGVFVYLLGGVWGVVTRCQRGLELLGLWVLSLPAARSPGRGHILGTSLGC